MGSFAEDRRADRAAEAEQRRIDQAAAEALRVERVRAADERAARLREQQRAEKDAARKVRAVRRSEMGASLTAGNVYRKGTLALVIASGLGSLPAQVLHFVGISPMLLPLPLAIEGAAWVMAAGVAYADERGLPGWVRWFLRLLVVAAAGFAATINYDYGSHLSGLSPSDARAAGIGLAAVTLLGPVLFEIRQWVTNLSGQTGDEHDKARRVHDRKRRRQHHAVARLADRLVSAAPFGVLSFEDAFAHAWEIETGTSTPGMSPKLHRRAARSVAELAQAQRPPAPRRWWRKAPPVALASGRPIDTTPNTESADTSTNRSTADLGKSTRLALPASLPKPVVFDLAKPVKPIAVRTAAAASPRPRRVTGRVPQAARSTRPARTAEQLLIEARTATANWSIDDLTAEGIRKAVHTSPAKARVLRETLRAERTPAPDEAAA
ncbi:hypothetical protein B046DRAFT_02306 [Streptomyces sp. LamerLS-316]|uniref:hypothetical protein n=1 Tax=unclassified Streptomyces TaxID=2593676 RepID=UPI000823D739|nr:hypothetical protein [Streptomyces sp. SID4921]SCK30405.1 hypothetical protein B046DRAFT_02306 [Streptomyces sp. LamerLS-316]